MCFPSFPGSQSVWGESKPVPWSPPPGFKSCLFHFLDAFYSCSFIQDPKWSAFPYPPSYLNFDLTVQSLVTIQPSWGLGAPASEFRSYCSFLFMLFPQ